VGEGRRDLKLRWSLKCSWMGLVEALKVFVGKARRAPTRKHASMTKGSLRTDHITQHRQDNITSTTQQVITGMHFSYGVTLFM
jgi:hypothetical protein